MVSIVVAVCFLAIDDSVATRSHVSVAPRASDSSDGYGILAGGGRGVVFRSQVIALGRRNIELPTLMYHYIRKPPSILADRIGYNLSVSPSDFSAQMDWLAVHGYHPVEFNDVRAYFAGKQPLPAKPVIITLDDGYADLYTTAYPILEAHGFKAVAYIVSGFVGQPRYVTAEQVLQLDRNGIEIASHTVEHANLARLTGSSLRAQLVDSKQWLESLLGHPVLDFAYPSGRFNAEVVAAVMAAGYSTAATEIYSTYHSLADRYTWSRVRVRGGESLAEFVRNLGVAMPSSTIATVVTATATAPPDLAPPLLAGSR